MSVVHRCSMSLSARGRVLPFLRSVRAHGQVASVSHALVSFRQPQRSLVQQPAKGFPLNKTLLFPRTSLGSQTIIRRLFQSESDYHTSADETLENIQDTIEQALEDNGIPEFEVTLASGVLTLVLPPHGTWVINKQTPNQQLWWSSPISGPRRYEYENDDWVYTRDTSHSTTLSQTLNEEINQIYGFDLEL